MKSALGVYLLLPTPRLIIFPLCVLIYYSIAMIQDGQWRYKVQASFLEIYNEELRDLLEGYGESGGGGGGGGAMVKKPPGGRSQQGVMTR